MGKVLKNTIGIFIFLVMTIVLWFGYSYMNAKPADRSATDGAKAAQEYIKKRKEYYRNEEK